MNIDHQKAYYDERWPTEGKFINSLEVERLTEIFAAILKILKTEGRSPQANPLTICDVGSGRGWLCNQLSSLGKVTGLELSSTAVELASKQWPHVDYRQANILDDIEIGRFDIVVTSEVIEHVPNHALFVERLWQLTEPGGYIIITTPNRRIESAYDHESNEQQPLEDWLTPAELRALVSRKFKLVESRTITIDFSYKGIFRVLSAPKVIAIARAFGCSWIREGIFRWFDLGLHQLVVAKRVD